MKKLLLLVLSLLLAQGAVADNPPTSMPLYAATFKGMDGQPFALSQLRGKVAVVNFWATWCPPCRKEIPDLVEAFDKYRKQDVVILGVAVEDNIELVGEFARAYNINYPLAAGKEKGIELMQAMGNTLAGLPYTLVLDAKGNIVATKRGRMNAALLEKALLAAQAGAE